MNVLDEISFEDILHRWGLHEGLTLLRDTPQMVGWHERYGREPNNPAVREHAIKLIRLCRSPVIEQIERASIISCWKATASPADAQTLYAMTDPGTARKALAAKAKEVLADPGSGGQWARTLRDNPNPVRGQFLAVARNKSGPCTFLDGIHRGSAWYAHVEAGRGYEIEIALVLTTKPVYLWEGH